MKRTINQRLQKCIAMPALAGLAMLLMTGLPAVAGDSARAPQVIPPDDLTGIYGDLLARWWQWTLAFPATADPASDTASQEANQSGPVWFLAGLHGGAISGGVGVVTRQITVPAGTVLFFPILSLENDNIACPTFTDYTVPQLRAGNTNSWSAVSQTSCTIDGVAVGGLENPQTTPYLIQSPVFSYTLADHDNIAAADLGEPCVSDGETIFPVVAEGTCILLAPLSPGQHVIQFIGIVGPPSAPFVYFNETYNVTVTPFGHK